MNKLRLDIESIQVETFSTRSPDTDGNGTVRAFGESEYQTRCNQTCNFDPNCYNGNTDIDMGCSADCTGLGVECYTGDPVYYACTAEPCTGPAVCTNNQYCG